MDSKTATGQATSGGTETAGDISGGRIGVAVPSGEIKSSQDVVALLQRICQYYERNEPSSPIPLLLRRAIRLVSKSFVDILRDLSPDALSKLELISGEKSDAT